MAQSRSFRALWALEESGLDYEYVAIKLFGDPADSDSAQNIEYLALNLQGKVPTLVHQDLVLTESVAILNYIGRQAPDSELLPRIDPASYAHHDELVCFILAELEQPLWSSGKHRFALPPEQRIPQMLETAKFEFAKAVSTLDKLLGDDFSTIRSEEHTSELQSRRNLVCRLLLEKKKNNTKKNTNTTHTDEK